MRVNNINSNLNFKRVIPIDYISNKEAKRQKGIDTALLEIEDILNSNEPFFYSKQESAKIREFFRQKIEDYNGKNGVIITKVKGRTFLVTGEEAEYIRKNKYGLTKYSNSGTPEGNRQRAAAARKKLEDMLLDRVEDGHGKRADCIIAFVSQARRDGRDTCKTLSEKELSRFDAIKYSYSYYSRHNERFHDLKSSKSYTSYSAEIYDTGEIEI